MELVRKVTEVFVWAVSTIIFFIKILSVVRAFGTIGENNAKTVYGWLK